MSDAIDLDSPEVKTAIAKAAKALFEEEAEGLSNKNKELLAEVKKLKQGRNIDPADVEKLESEIDSLKGQLTEAQKVAKKAAGDAEKAAKAQAEAEGSVAKLLVDNGLTDALTKANVTNPVHIKAAKAMLAGQVQIADDNGAKVARVGDKALADYITEWAGSDEGKHFVTAADTSGGGAQGNGGRATNTPADMGGDKAARLARANELLKQNSE